MKYIIDVERIENTDLYRAKGFSALVFDSYGLSLLEPYEKKELTEGCIIRTPNGTTMYEFKGFSNDGHLNAINLANGKYVNLSADKYVVIG